MVTDFEKLYARNSKGQIKTWTIIVESIDNTGRIVINYGLLNGKQQQKEDFITSGKNIRKANETTPYQQAESEALSRWNLQRRIGFKMLHEYGAKVEGDLNALMPLANTDLDDNIIPMKCQQYHKVKRKKWPYFGQPKINGVRCIVTMEDGKIIFRSKKGLEYNILGHIANDFPDGAFNFDGQDIIFDGELYIPGYILSDITSAVRVNNMNTIGIKFYCFDIAIPGLTQEERDQLRFKLLPEGRIFDHIVNVKQIIIRNDEHAQEYADWCIKEGFEGAVFRHPAALYGFGTRPSSILKLKRWKDGEFTIVDVIPEEKAPTHGMFVCEWKGKTFKVVPQGSFETKEQYLKDKMKLIGKKLTVKYYEDSVNDLPFHAVGIAIRDYE